MDRNSKIQRYTEIELHFANIVFVLCADTTAERTGLLGIGLRQEQRELIAADTKSEIRGAHRVSERGGGEVQNLVAEQMPAAIVHFLQFVHIENHKGELLVIAIGAVEFFFTVLIEEAAIVKAGESVGGGVDLEFLEFFVLHQNRDAKKIRGGEHVRHGGLQGDWAPEAFGQFAAARENPLPVFIA